tara:strand:+ start:168 stop:473 length:306 start_codon:yes stop_codon:yes gene_type:complete
METKPNTNKYCCEICEFSTINKTNFNRHILTKKHIKATKEKEILLEKDKLACKNCGRNFITRSGLWKHNKTCINKEEELSSLLQQLLLQNNEILKFLKEQK